MPPDAPIREVMAELKQNARFLKLLDYILNAH